MTLLPITTIVAEEEWDWKTDMREENYPCSEVEAINALPAVQPEPSQVARDIATIIENEKDMRVIAQPKASLIWQPVYGWFRCGACKKIYPNALMKYFNICEYQPKFNFCPNCGADMRGDSMNLKDEMALYTKEGKAERR